jgi:hypothetical protein
MRRFGGVESGLYIGKKGRDVCARTALRDATYDDTNNW